MPTRPLEHHRTVRHSGLMATQESKRLDLYNGLQEVLGTDRAKTLMTYLPAVESNDLLTKAYFDGRLGQVESRMDQLDNRLHRVEGRLEYFDTRFAELGKRIDRVLLAVVGGLFVVLAGVFISAALF